jgi:hypothetical protein
VQAGWSSAQALVVRVALGDFPLVLQVEPAALGLLHDGYRARAVEIVRLLTSHA